MKTKIHEPKDVNEKLDWAEARNFSSFSLREMADCLMKYLQKGEMVLVDSLGQYIDDPNAFDRTITELRENGIGQNYKFLRYPASQNIQQFRRLFAVKCN